MEEEKNQQITPEPETISEPTAVSEPKVEPVNTQTKPATKPNNAFFKFRYILSLITGWAFYGLLASLVMNIAGAIFKQEVSLYDGEGAATLLAAFVIVTIIHVILNWSVKGAEYQEQKGKALPIIYSVPLGISTCVFLFLLLSPLFQLVLGFGENLDIGDFGSQCVTSITVVAWIAFALANEFNLKNFFVDRKIYTIVTSAVALIAIILFIIIPVNTLRGSEKDRNILEDFSAISNEIEDYADENYRLPKSLSEIEVPDDLHNSISSYDYKAVSSSTKNDDIVCVDPDKCNSTSRSRTFTYELCATFHAASDSSYHGHKKGYDCIKYDTNVYNYSYNDDTDL